MAPRPTSPALRPPPELPSVPESEALVGYLRTFSLWCRNMFQDKLDAHAALPGVLLRAHDAPPGTNAKVFLIRVDSAGAISATLVPLGEGQP